MKKKRYMWRPEDEAIIIANQDMEAKALRKKFFPQLTLVAVQHKQSRLIEQQRFTKTGPWSDTEIAYLQSNISQGNAFIQEFIPRPSKDLDAMRWAIRHGKSTNKRGPRQRPVQGIIIDESHFGALSIEEITVKQLRNDLANLPGAVYVADVVNRHLDAAAQAITRAKTIIEKTIELNNLKNN